MLKLALPLALAISVLSSCDDGAQVELSSSTISGSIPDKVSAKVSPDQVCSDTTYTDTEGNTIQGRRNCQDTRVVCEKMGDTFCMMEDKSLYGVIDKDLTEENIRKDLPFLGTKGNLLGDLEPCTENGQTDCIVPDDALSMSDTLLKSKVLKGQIVADVTGEFDPGFPKLNEVLATDTVNGVPGTIPACAADGDTTCRADNTYRAVNQSELIADRIRSTVTLGGVTGTYTGAYGECTGDNQTLCVTTPNYISVDKNALEPAKIRTGIVLAGVTGSLTERSAACAADGAVGCTTTASYPAADFGRIAAANIKNGANVAGTNGLYPSATHKLTTDTPAVDLAAGNFEARVASTTSFEFWDAAGNRYTGNGDGDLVPANIITGTTIFGVVGAMAGTPAACSDSLALNCVASATHKAVDASKLLPENIKNGVTLDNGGTPVVGLYPSATHPLVDDSVITDLTATNFESSLATAANYEFWDSHGTKYTQAGSADLVGSNIVTGKTLFSVAGSLATRPANCSDGLRTACVTTASHPSYDPSELHESVIKSGVTIADVMGKYPSITYTLDGADGTLDLTQGNFTSQLRQATTFEYFDSAGQRYTGQGDALLTASHLRSGTTIHDVTGSVTATSGNCTAGNQTGCVATSSYPALRKADLTPGVIKAGATVMGVAGQYPSVTFPLAGSTATDDLEADLNTRLASNDSFEFFDASGTRHVRNGTTDLTATNIANGANIFDVAGSMAEQPDPCTTEADTGCLSTATYPSFDTTTLTEGVIKNGVSIGGVTGEYPSAGYPLPGALVTTDLNAPQFNDQVAKLGAYEYWDSTGTRHTKTVPANLQGSQVLSGQTIFNIAGTAAGMPANCSAGNTTSCVTTSAFPSYRPADVTPGIIKAGTVIGSVTGQYPSSTFPLPGAGNTIDLIGGELNTRIRNTAFFEYWDSTGSRYTGSGSAHILPENIKSGVNIFGVVGGIVDASSSTLQPHQIRYGVTINGVEGTLKLNCRNNRVSSGSLEVDDVNAGGGYALPKYNEWGDAHNCTEDIFVDITGGDGCNSSGDVCIYQDSITGLKWRQYPNPSNVSWYQGKNNCLALGGGWRMPTYKETATGYNHGLRNLFLLSGYQGTKFPENKSIWTSTNSTRYADGSGAYLFNMGGAEAGDRSKTSDAKALCVKY